MTDKEAVELLYREVPMVVLSDWMNHHSWINFCYRTQLRKNMTADDHFYCYSEILGRAVYICSIERKFNVNDIR